MIFTSLNEGDTSCEGRLFVRHCYVIFTANLEMISLLIPGSALRSGRRPATLLLLLHLLAFDPAPLASATPLFTPTVHRQHKTAKPKWVNPCGLNPNAVRTLGNAFGGRTYQVSPMSDAALLEEDRAKIALPLSEP